MASPPPKSLLIFTQVFPPDPAAVGQYMLDAAVAMQNRGHRVRVFTADRGYENPTLRYPAREMLDGVEVRRVPFSSFGKKPVYKRLLGTISFMLQCFWITLTARRVGGILFSTSPPMVGFIISIAAMLRRVPTAYWAMDLNPDQLIALRKITAGSLTARVLEAVNRFILKHTSLVIALDRFMADRLRHRAKVDHKMVVIPPWPHERHVSEMETATNPFRQRHNLTGKFVVMYSGNHTASNPLTTLLDATLAFKNDPNLIFAFVGGGLGKQGVECFIGEHGLTNVISIPYQPLADLRQSLSAGDVHVVSLGAELVGIVHPCKIYSAMAVARPILFFGPNPSHISDLLEGHSFGWQIAHGEVAKTIETLRQLRSLPVDELHRMGQLAHAVLNDGLSQENLCGRFCDALEKHLQLACA